MPAATKRMGAVVAVTTRQATATGLRTQQTTAFTRHFSVLNRPPPNYPGHVPLTRIERGALAIGSAVGSLLNPRRGGSTALIPSPCLNYS